MDNRHKLVKSLFFLLNYLHTYVFLVKVVFLTYVLSAINRRKLVKGRHFTYLLTYMLTYVLYINDRYKSVKVVFSHICLHPDCERSTPASSAHLPVLRRQGPANPGQHFGGTAVISPLQVYRPSAPRTWVVGIPAGDYRGGPKACDRHAIQVVTARRTAVLAAQVMRACLRASHRQAR